MLDGSSLPPALGRHLDQLNDEQRAAATCGDGAHLVLAGPGTGKTATLTARYAWLVGQEVPPPRIMAVTFTRKAADELGRRIAELTGLNPRLLQIGTFHALAGRMLRQIADSAGLSPDFKIIDEAGQRAVLAANGIRWKNEDGDLLEIIGGAKESLRTPDDFARHLAQEEAQGRIDRSSPLWGAVEAYRLYQRHLETNGLVDFADLIGHMVRALEADAALRARMADRFAHILIDEYQDVNPAQVRLVAALLRSDTGLWVVGDDDQCLYSFRSSDVDIILSFEARHPGARVHRLVRNYRSTPPILTLAQSVITGNRRRYPKVTEPAAERGPRVTIVSHDSAAAEGRWLAAAIGKLIAAGTAPAQIAALFRTGAASIALRLELRRSSVAYIVQGARDFWRAYEVKLFLGFLAVAAGEPMPPHELSGHKGRRVGEAARQAISLTFVEQVRRGKAAVQEEKPARPSLERSAEWDQNMVAIAELAAEAGSLRALRELANREMAAARAGATPAGAVVISTVHSAKGLEWDAVFVGACEDGILPHRNAPDEEEERRIAFVAMTRARRILVLSYSLYRFETPAIPSRFLYEAIESADSGAFDWRGGIPPRPRYDLAQSMPDPSVAPARGTGSSAPRKSKEERQQERRRKNREAGKPERSGFVWTEEEDEALRQAFTRRKPLDRLAARHHRSEGSVAGRMAKLGLIEVDCAVSRYQKLVDPVAFREQQSERLQLLAADYLGTAASAWLSMPHAVFDGLAPRDAIDRPDCLKLARQVFRELDLQRSGSASAVSSADPMADEDDGCA